MCWDFNKTIFEILLLEAPSKKVMFYALTVKKMGSIIISVEDNVVTMWPQAQLYGVEYKVGGDGGLLVWC